MSAGARYGLRSPRRPAATPLRRSACLFLTFAIRRDEEAVLVDLGVDRQATRSGRCSCLPASRSGRCGRSARCARRALRSPARLRFKPPGPRADSRRSCVSCDSGFVWSTTCDSSPRPKKYSIAAETLFGLMSVRGVMSCWSRIAMRSCTVRRSLRKPLRSSSAASSSIVRSRRLPRWSMSSTCALRRRAARACT